MTEAMKPMESTTTTQKVMWRLLPILMGAFFVAYLDRLSVSVAALQMRGDLGISEAAFGLGAGIFFITYFIFEIPSNIILQRVGARRWIARIMWTWGLVTVATMFATGPVTFYIARALLGVAEAGFYAGVIFYLTQWFPARERGRSFSWFQLAVPITFAFGSAMAGSLLLLDRVAGIAGWQWVFLVTGLVAVGYGFVVWNFLTDTPADAGWLSQEEKEGLAGRLRSEHQRRQAEGAHTVRAAFTNGWVWFFSLLYFAIILGQWGIGFWLPQIVAGEFPGASDFQVSLLSAAPWLVALIAIVPVARHSDRTGERRWHLAVPCAVSALGFALSAYFEQPFLALAATALALVGLMAAVPVFWNLPSAVLTGAAAASGIALVNSLGNLSGFVGPSVLGLITQATGSSRGGIAILALFLLVAAGLALMTRRERPALEPAEQPARPISYQVPETS